MRWGRQPRLPRLTPHFLQPINPHAIYWLRSGVTRRLKLNEAMAVLGLIEEAKPHLKRWRDSGFLELPG